MQQKEGGLKCLCIYMVREYRKKEGSANQKRGKLETRGT